MDRLRKYLVYTILIGWLCAVALPMVWVLVNSLRSSQEFVQNPFGMPWIVTGVPADGLLERDEVATALAHAQANALDTVSTESLEWLGEHFDAVAGAENGVVMAGVTVGSDGTPLSEAQLSEIEATASRPLARSAAIDNYRKAWVESNFGTFFFNSIWVTF